ncbi:MAG TPA: ATP-dependent DNA helicase RecQ [Bacteroidales bacterium]|nr:MAG: ATP-dependent DNA helicase RecQ [Bacteroidetes bacterium ADurb.Bin041]HNV50071.1 ATP-dependent DNA helicase RecQ [Bacteroidales bacterium]HPW43034.1 ATP-dependent DNA helicase RecQ [Bacteroidales bacterium]
MDIQQILIKYWGYSGFRPMQEDIIRSVLAGQDTLALMPTGGGKSICFQVPALAKEGICIVISPLIALMKDQVDRLKALGINAFAIYSGMHQTEIELALNNATLGNAKLLYISPERLATPNFREVLRYMKVNLIAVDEAHCISQWGYDFRPPYLKIAEIRHIIPDAPVLALTASATPVVVDDIQEKLGFSTPNLIRQSFERKNLAYIVVKEENKMGKLVEMFKKVHGSAIVYAGTRRRTYEFARELNKNGIPADHYHAGMENEQREKKQKAWMSGHPRVIVATNAFGMGIDKPDVRLVVHVDLPGSIEAYFQEAGRAGRDGKKAWSVILYQDSDLLDANSQFEFTFPDMEMIKSVYHALGNYFSLAVGSGKNTGFDFDISDFCNQFNLNPISTFNSLKFLEKEGYLLLSEGLHFPPRIFVKLQGEKLYKFRVENADLDIFLKIILRSYTGLFTQFTKFNINELARRTSLSVEQTFAKLEKLNRLGAIAFVPPKSKPQIIFTEERLDAKDLYISKENYSMRKKMALERLNSLNVYLTSNSRCRSISLLNYFGESKIKRCGQCDVCLERNKVDLNEQEFNAILDQIKPLLKTGAFEINDLIAQTERVKKEKVLKVIEWLLDNNKIAYTLDKKLYWL